MEGNKNMSNALLTVKNLSVGIEDEDRVKEILHRVDLEIRKGEIHVLLGPNGAGKSTLGYALMGSPRYVIEEGEIYFEGKDISEDSADKRAKAGMYLSFQNPLEVPGLAMKSFIRNAMEAVSKKRVRLPQFRKDLEKNLEILNMDPSYADRALNVGFSGGEKKKAEILQLLMLAPKFAILDETDSGLDVDAVRTVSEGIKAYQKNQSGSLLIITHSTRILDALQVDYTHIMVDGRLVKTGDASLVEEINRNGFEKYIEESRA